MGRGKKGEYLKKFIVSFMLIIFILCEANIFGEEKKEDKGEALEVKKHLKYVLKEKRVDLEFEQKDIREVLDYIAKKTETNICFYEKEEEEKPDYLLTVSLRNITAIGALRVITRLKGLSFYLDEYVAWVGKSEDLKELMDIITKIYSPKSGNVDALKDIIENLLSEKGKMAVDKRLSIIVVTDREDIIRHIDSTCRALRHNIGPEIRH